MSVQFTEEQLNSFDKATLITLFLQQQEQLKSIDDKLQLVLEQMSDMNRHRFGRSTEKSVSENQLAFRFEEGELCIFNEAEAVAYEEAADSEESTATTKKKKQKANEKRISAVFQ